MRQPIIAGNWKMNKTNQEAADFVKQLTSTITNSKTEVIISPPFTALESTAQLLEGSNIKLSAQNISEHVSGAYTGEISADMLTNTKCTHVIIGHSERREYYHESNQLCQKKCEAALKNKLIPIYCIGETLDQREATMTLDIIKQQLVEYQSHKPKITTKDIHTIIKNNNNSPPLP